MSGTRSPSRTEPATKRNLWRLGLILSPFVWGAVAINLFMLGLIFRAAGWSHIPPVTVLWLSLPLGLPATWAAARWVRSLIREAEGRKG